MVEIALVIVLAIIFLKMLPLLLLLLGLAILIWGHYPALGLALVIIWAVVKRR